MRNEIITGFFEIEDILNEDNGSGKLIALASRPGMGKSTFIQHLLSRMVSLNESNVLLFSLEMSKKQVIERLKRNDWLTDEDFKRIHIDDSASIDVGYIEKTISEHENLSAVFVDYAGLIDNFVYSCEREKILLRLKKICESKNIHLIYACQLPRSLETRINKRPVLFDIDSDSAKIADAIFAIYRRAYYLAELEDASKTIDWNKVELICLKNAFGDLFKLDLNFSGVDLTYSYDYTEYDAVLENRNELHLHTKLSDDASVIGVREIFENAQKLGLKSIAFTNLNNVQDFPEIMMCAKKYENIKVVYGAEVKYKFFPQSPAYSLTLLAKNQAGIKDLYKVISSISEAYDNIINLHTLMENRKNLLVGSCGSKGELFDLIGQDKIPYTINTFYDYFEIFPSKDVFECETNKKIFYLGEELGVPVVAASNGHYIEKTDKVCLDIVNLAQGKEIIEADEYYVRTTKEMLEEFSYLGNYGAEKVTLENPQILIDVIEKTEPLKTGNYYPVFENAYIDLEKACYNKAFEIYGNPLPELAKERLDTELGFLKGEQFATQYLLAKKLTTFAKENGQITTARGAVGSTFIAFLLGISEINPLSPHYYCDCHYFEVSNLADDGFDLPEKVCPVCNKKLRTDGHNIPYEVFMGFKGDKMPDVDLNFPGEFVLDVQRFMGECFGNDKVVQAGTIATVWDGIAEAYIEKYEKTKNISFSLEERENLINKIVGVKRSVGIHPCGVMVIPQNMEAQDFTPLNQNWAPRSTTHFDFHHLHDTILKQDILGHSVLDLLLELEKQTNISIDSIDFKDPKIYEMFRNADTDGISEFDRDFAKDLLLELQPQNFNELVKISCLCHGTNVWTDNAEHLIKNKICNISEVVAARGDIFNYLTSKGMDKYSAFRIMEMVRKGLWAKDKLSEWDKKSFVEEMQNFDVPEWYIESLSKIHYMFPKAHAIAYVMNVVRLMWFKIYYPEEFKKALEKTED
jgi:DNA polymerase-3 subunit alpha (Gram-positive type)